MDRNLKSSPFGLNHFTSKNTISEQNDIEINFDDNIFSNPEKTEGKTEEISIETQTNTKRLNDLDSCILGKVVSYKENKKINLIQKIKNYKFRLPKNFEDLLVCLFPIFDKSKILKESLYKLKKLNSETKSLLNTKIPFGESQIRYKELSNNISLACSIQTNLKKKIG